MFEIVFEFYFGRYEQCFIRVPEFFILGVTDVFRNHYFSVLVFCVCEKNNYMICVVRKKY